MNNDPSAAQYVSRGGIKLQAALDQFQIDVKDKVVMDCGSSTGGFVDCLLQNGAAKVYAADTCYGELAWKLRNDPNVVVMERTNILHLERLPYLVGAIHESPERIYLATIDVGWTKLELVLPVVKNFLKEDGIIIALLKPQYEADKRSLKKGLVPEELVEGVKEEALQKITVLGFKVIEVMESPILGGSGNKEYLVYLKP